MIFAVLRFVGSLGSKVRALRARAIRTTTRADVHHAVVGMLLAIQRCLTFLQIKTGPPRAGGMCATFSCNVHHPCDSVKLAKHC